MAKHRKTIGTGITMREVVTYDGEDMQPAMVEFFSQWEAKRKKGGGDYGAACLHIIERCHRIIANSGRPYETDGPADFDETDSPVDFAKRILRHHQIAQAAIKRGDADAAARFALDVGLLAAQAIIKQVWEPHALRGKNNVLALKEGLRVANKQRIDDAKQRHLDWQAQADKIWARNKHLSASAVARLIANSGDNWRTIRRKIHRK